MAALDPDFRFAALVPELLVADIGVSLRFWRDLCGFRIAFERLGEGFAYLERDGAQVMLEERGRSRNWVTGPLEAPLGRGLNLQIRVSSIDPIVGALATAGWELFMAPETKTYRVGEADRVVRQFLVQDPDGYLVRFAQKR